MFSSFRFYFRSFTVSGLIFKFLYAFELIFVGGVRYGSSFILLSVAIQFFQYHSLKILSFPQWVFLTPLSEIDHVCVGLYPGSHSVPLVSVPVLLCILHSFHDQSYLFRCYKVSILGEITVWFRVVVWLTDSFYLGEITVWFTVVVWLTDSFCFRCHSSMCHGIIKGKTRRQFCPLPNACTWGGSPWGQPCLSCLSSPGSCDAPQQQLPLKERQQSLLPRGLRQHWPLVTSVAKLLVSFGKHTQRSLLMNIMDKF